MENYLVLDLGGTFIKYALMNRAGDFLEKGKIPSAAASREEMYGRLDSLAQKYRGRYVGAAVSMPGRINTEQGVAHTGGSFQFIKEEPFARELEALFQTPVTIANDGKCAAEAEVWNGALSDVENGVVLVFGTAIGGGVVLNRRVFMGSSGGAGELSFLVTDARRAFEKIEYDQEGMPHLWTGIASSSTLAKDYAQRKGTPLEGAGCVELFDAWDAGDENARAIVEKFAQNVAAGIFSVQSVIDAQKYAIGGGISARPAVTQSIRSAVKELWAMIPSVPFTQPDIVTCRYGNDANLIGALRFHLERICPA